MKFNGFSPFENPDEGPRKFRTAKALKLNLKSTMLKAEPLRDPVCEWVLEVKA